jgi:hypothetical protein
MKYLGIIMIVIGALIMVASYASDKFFNSGTVDMNWLQILAMLFIVFGVPTHIHVTGKSSKA